MSLGGVALNLQPVAIACFLFPNNCAYSIRQRRYINSQVAMLKLDRVVGVVSVATLRISDPLVAPHRQLAL